jgi:hypothetical protein
MAVLQRCRKQWRRRGRNRPCGILGTLDEKIIPGWPQWENAAASSRPEIGLLNRK